MCMTGTAFLIMIQGVAGAQGTVTSSIQPEIQLCEAARTQLLSGRDGTLFLRNNLYTTTFRANDTLLDLATRLHQEFAKRGIEVVVSLMPSELSMHADEFDFSDEDAKKFTKTAYLQRYAAALTALRTAGFITPDILTYALAQPDAVRRLYMPRREDHLNVDGGRIVAHSLAAAIQNLAAYKALPEVIFQTRNTGTQVIGGGIPGIVRKACPDLTIPDEVVSAFVTEPVGVGLLDDSSQPGIVYVGTSYSAEDYPGGKRANIVGFLREEIRRDIYNNSIAGGGVFGSLTEYFVSQKHKQFPAPILVWELSERFINAVFSPDMRQIIPAINGICQENRLIYKAPFKLNDPIDVVKRDASVNQFISLQLDNDSITTFDMNVIYRDGFRDKVTISHTPRRPMPASFFLDVLPGKQVVRIETSSPIASDGKFRLCRY